MARALARRHGLPYIDLEEQRPSPGAMELIPLRTLQRVVAVPVALKDDRLLVAVADPSNILGLDELKIATRHAIDLAVGGREEIVSELERLAAPDAR